jgi:hypothetical protein
LTAALISSSRPQILGISEPLWANSNVAAEVEIMSSS